jgi:hypothetical protein
MRTLFIFLIAFLTHSSLMAVTATWIGGDGEWHDPQQWDTGQVPGPEDDVVIPAGNSTVTIPNHLTVYIHSIEVGTDAVLSVFGEISLKTTNSYGIWCKGEVNFASGALMEATGDINNTTGIWVEQGVLVVHEGAALFFNYFKNGINVTAGYFFNFGKVQVKDIRTNFAAIQFEAQGIGYNYVKGSIFFKNMEAIGLNLSTNSDRFYNYGLIQSLNGFEGSAIQTIGNARFYNYKSGNVIIDYSDNTSIYNSGEFYNLGKIKISAEGAFKNWHGLFHNLPSGDLLISDPDKVESGMLGLNGVSTSSYVVNEGTITINGMGNGKNLISISSGSEFKNTSSGTVNLNFGDSDKGLFVADGIFNNNGGAVTLSGGASDDAILLLTPGSILNDDCGKMNILGGRIWLNQGYIQNDAWMLLNNQQTDIIIVGVGEWVNNGLILDPHLVTEGESGFDNQGVVFDRLDPAPVYPGPFIQDALTIGDFDEVSNISWHLSKNGPQAAAFLPSSNQVSLYSSSIGAKSLWLHFDFDLDNCGEVWIELPVEGGVQAPPPPLPEFSEVGDPEADWSVFPIRQVISCRLQ